MASKYNPAYVILGILLVLLIVIALLLVVFRNVVVEDNQSFDSTTIADIQPSFNTDFDKTGWKTFTNPLYPYQIQYPPEDAELVFHYNEGFTPPRGTSVTLVFLGVPGITGVTIHADFAEKSDFVVGNDFDLVREVTRRRPTIKKHDGTTVQRTWIVIRGVNWTGFRADNGDGLGSVLIHHGNQIYQATYDNTNALATDILSTLRFTD